MIRFLFAALLLLSTTLATGAAGQLQGMPGDAARGRTGISADPAMPGANRRSMQISPAMDEGTPSNSKQSKQRYEELRRDTDKLLQLATELKLQVDKSGEHTLSLDAMRKAQEIEKLAHSVREKMKGQ